MTKKYHYEITPRPADLGGGWRLALLEDGKEVGGGVFPSSDNEAENIEAHNQAAQHGAEWLDTCPS